MMLRLAWAKGPRRGSRCGAAASSRGGPAVKSVWVLALVVAAVTVVIVAAVGLGILKLPGAGGQATGSGEKTSQSFYFTLPGPGPAYEHPYAGCPDGGPASGTVSFSWTATGTVQFEVLGPSASLAYSDQAKSGSGSFSPACGTYDFLIYAVAGDNAVSASVSGEWVH